MKSWGLKWLAAQSWRRRLVSLSLPTGHTCGRPNEIIGPLLSTYTCYMACSTVQVHVTQIYICNTASQYHLIFSLEIIFEMLWRLGHSSSSVQLLKDKSSTSSQCQQMRT